MDPLDQVMEFMVEALSNNAGRGCGSVVSIRITPNSKRGAGRAMTQSDVCSVQKALDRFDGDFKKLFKQKVNS